MADETQPTDAGISSGPPPTWSEVTSDPSFADLTPDKQLVAFSRWHDDAFNFASQQSDWAKVKDTFNVKAAAKQAELSQAAGGITPDQARANVATGLINDANIQTPDDRRALLRQQPPDIQHAYYQAFAAGTLHPTEQPINRINIAEPMPFVSNADRLSLGSDLTAHENLSPDEAQALTRSAASSTVGGTGLGELSQTPVSDALQIDPRTQVKDTSTPEIDPNLAAVGTPSSAVASQAGAQLTPREIAAASPDQNPIIAGLGGATHALLDTGRRALGAINSAVTEGGGSAPSALANLVSPQNASPTVNKIFQIFGVTNDDRQFLSDVYTNTRADAFKSAAQSQKLVGVDPNLADTLGAKVGEFAGGAATVFALPELFIPFSAARTYGTTLEKTGDEHQAREALIKDTLFNVAFMGGGHLIGKALPETAGVISRALAGVGGNLAMDRILKAGAAAQEAKPGERKDAFFKELGNINLPDSAAAVVYGLLPAIGHDPAAIEFARAKQGMLKAANALEATSPETAKAMKALIAQNDLQGAHAALVPQPPEPVKPPADSREAAKPDANGYLSYVENGSHILEGKNGERLIVGPAEAKPVITRTISPEAQQTRIAAEAARATPTAAPAIEAPTVEAPTVEAPAESPVAIHLTHNRDGSESATVAGADTATPEQLAAVKSAIDKSDLLPEQKTQAHEQIDQAIAAKQAPEEPAAPAAEPVTEPTPVAETVKPPAPTDPNQFTPALRTTDGEIIPVPKGQTHDEVKIPAALAAEANPTRAAAILDAEHGYVANGHFYSRDETGTALGQTEPSKFSSQRLRDLQAPPVAEPAAPEARLAAPAEPLAPAPAPRPLAPIAREEAAALPTEQEIKNQVLKARTPEEKTAAVQASQDREVQLALESGLEPRLNDIAGRQGSREKVQATRDAVRAALAAKYPPETVPEGSKEITLTNEVTGDKLPQVVEPKLDANGDPVPNTTVTRPKFTNDADITAQELAKGSAVLLPEDFKLSDVNPAIKVETQPDGTRKVVSVESRYGTVDGPDGNPERGTVDYNAAFKADTDTGKAHKVLAMGDTAAHISDLTQAVDQEMASRGIAADALERFDTDNPDPTLEVATATKAQPSTPGKVRDNFGVLDLLGIPPGDRKAAPIQRALEKIASSDKFQQLHRDQAKKLLATGNDFSNIKIRRVQDTSGDAPAGSWDPNTRTITINLSVGHEGGVANTVLHEVAHDIIHDNFIKPKNDVHRNAANLTRKIQQKLLRAAFKESVGREATSVGELSQWADAQRQDINTPELNPFAKYTDRKYYGVAHPEELLATVGTEASIRELASKLAPVDAEGPKPKNLLSQLYDAARRLFTGGKKEPESAFDQLIQNFADLSVKDTGTEAATGDQGPPLEAKAKTASLDELNKLDRVGLEDRWVQAGHDVSESYSMTTKEIRDALSGGSGDILPDSGKIERSGWLGPDGKFVEADGGNHYAAAMSSSLSKEYPKFGKALKAYLKSLGREPTLSETYEFMDKHGFARIAHGGTEIYAQGKLSNTQRRVLEDAAIEQNVPAYHDFGGPRIGKIFDPGAVFNKAANPKDTVAEKEDLPSADPNAVRVQTVVGKNGKTTRNLHISDTATRADLLAMKEALPDVKGLSDADRKRMNEVIDSQIGPTTVLQTGKIAGSGAAGQRVSFGYDASGNIANIRGNQEANSVALDFGPVTRPSRLNPTKSAGEKRAAYDAAIADRTAMPFIVEAGGDKHQLEIMLDQVANAKEPSPEGIYQKFKAKLREAAGRPAPTLAQEYTPIVQHAIDNFDRLNGKTENFKQIMKEQIERERGVGISVGEMENYVTRLLKTPGMQDKIAVASSATGGSRYFVKGRRFETLADAISAGYRPITEGTGKATDIAELTHRRVETGERLVQQKLLENQLRKLVLPDGKPMLSANEYYEATSGKTEHRIPAGYRTVQTGGAPLVVHNDVAKTFEALYGQGSIPGFINATAGFLKRNTLVADTFHVGRIIAKELGYSGGKERVGYNKGLSLLEYADKDLDRALAAGEINQKQADYARENRPIAELLIKHGLNVGKVADNLAAQHAASIPGLKGFNPWVFQKLSRGAMLQTAIHNYDRNLSRFGGDSEKAARQTAVEYNEVFGNLQNQSIFKNKRFQDASRALILAPNWAESQFFAELRGYGQLLHSPVDIARGIKAGEGLGSLNRVGTVARGQATVILGMLAANQVINYLTTGHSTFQNKDGHYFDAFIPHVNTFGGTKGPGFYLNPMEIAAEYAHMGHRYLSQHMNIVDAVKQIAENKLSGIGHSIATLATNEDYSGKSFATTGDRLRASLTNLLPVPLPVAAVLERDPRSNLLFRPTRQLGTVEKQLLQSAGLKTTAELTPRSEVFALAHPFRPDKSYQDNAPAEYRDLRSALDKDQTENAQREIQLLLDRGHTLDNIRSAVPFSPEKFTGSDHQETLFRKSLTPDQMDLYKQAQSDHRASAARLTKILGQITPEQRKQSNANRR